MSALYHDDGIHPVRLRDDEVLCDVTVPPLADGWRSAYLKYRVRGSFDFPIVGVAVAARFDGEICTEARVVLQAVATHPVALPAVDEMLRGQRWTPELLDAAAEEAYRVGAPDGQHVWHDCAPSADGSRLHSPRARIVLAG